MKSNIKLLKIKGATTPSFEEPNGDAYLKAMNKIYRKVEEKRKIRNNSALEIKKLNNEMNRLKNQQIMAEDDFEEMEIKKQRKALQEKIDNTDDYSTLDVDAYAKKLISDPKIGNLRTEALKEFSEKASIAKEYREEFEKQYQIAMKEINRFLADSRSDSTFREADVRYNRYKN